MTRPTRLLNQADPMPHRYRTLYFATLLLIACPRNLPAQAAETAAPSIRAVVLHPVVAERFHCAEHPEGQLPYVGDALGTDCVMIRDGSLFTGDGSANDDYHIWAQPVLAPVDGTVVRVHLNPVTNEPGTPGEPPASMILVRRDDGVMVMIGHIDEPTVSEGDTVEAGQEIAVVGNNGISGGPHLHIGAWQDDEPLQIRWDLRAMARIRR